MNKRTKPGSGNVENWRQFPPTPQISREDGVILIITGLVILTAVVGWLAGLV